MLTETSSNAVPQRFEIQIQGMTCASCVARVERVVGRVAGVQSVSVNLATERAVVLPTPSTHPPDNWQHEVTEAIRRAGYVPSEIELPSSTLSEETTSTTVGIPAAVPPNAHSLRPTLVALALGSVLMIVAMVPMSASLRPVANIAQLLLSTVIVFVSGASIHRAALHAGRSGHLTMDTLVSLGALTAWVHSLITLARVGLSHAGHHGTGLYFETAGMIVAFVLLGRMLEARARAKAREALHAIASLLPSVAHRIRSGAEQTVPLADIRVGDTLAVRAHERVPVDGTLLDQPAQLDESLVTGESLPVQRQPGATICAGSLNTDQPLRVRATRVGKDSTVGRIARLVDEAQGSKAPVQRLVDRVASIFVPVVVLAALGTFVAGWLLGVADPLTRAVGVLVVACPCALGLATPTALMVGMGRAASRGILIRDATALEHASHITDFVFDKTGTLTTGRASVTAIVCVGSYDEDSVIALAAGLERSSNHPLARAIVRHAEERSIEQRVIGHTKETVGNGVSGRWNERSLHLGVPAESALESHPETRSIVARGATVVALSVDETPVAFIAFEDLVRDSAASVISQFVSRGIRTHMLTGDSETTARVVAAAVGITSVRARCTPTTKRDAVREIRERFHGEVAVVGDGVNDAPALAEGHVGIAMGSGTDIATHAAGITLVRNELLALFEALAIARATMRIVRQNLGWAMGYNLIAVPIAALGLLDRFGGPMLAAAAMAMSSVSVVSNSLRLRSLTLE